MSLDLSVINILLVVWFWCLYKSEGDDNLVACDSKELFKIAEVNDKIIVDDG